VAQAAQRLLIGSDTHVAISLPCRRSLQSHDGLLVGEQGGELLELPLPSPRVNRLFLQGKLVLEANGCLSGDLTEIRFGVSANL